MMRILVTLPLLLLLVGCNTYNLRYKAQPQPSGADLFADYTPLQGAVSFSIDTAGRRLEEVSIRKPDGTVVRPVNIAYPGFGKTASIGPGIGVGGGGVGAGIGVGIPIGPDRALGPTTATFEEQAIGSPPWELHLKVEGISPAVIPGVGGPASAK